ncbi:hypothetical protein [Streptomyces mutabilis]|nr:hypothetical protein [Streptomyces mutabilis]
MTINNKGGKYSPRNPMSPYYGKIGRNTRVRLSVPGDESYLQLDGDPAAYASTPDVASLDLTMDLDLRWEGEADWYATAPQMLIGKWGAAGQRSYHMRIEAGALYFHGARDGTVGPFQAQWLPALPRRAALRVTLTGGAIVRHYWAESLDGPWTQIGSDVTLPNPLTTGLFVSTAPLLIAPSQDDASATRPPVAGRVYRAEVRGAGNAVAASPDFRSQAASASGFTDSAGRAWTVAGGAEIRDRVDRFIGEISEWPQKWVASGADAWVPVQAAGILRRLGRGTKPLDSALRRRIPSFGPMAYWPMEEGQNATRAYSPLPGGDSLKFTNVQWAADSTLPSSGPLPTINAQTGQTAWMSGPVRNRSWASLPAWSVVWMYRMPQVPAARRTFMHISTTGTIRQWYIQMGPDDSRLLGLGYEGETLVDRTILTSRDIFGEWVKCRFSVEQQGSSIHYALVWTDVGGDAGFYENTVTGTTGRPTGVASPPGGYHSDLNGMAIGHISVWDHFYTTAYDNAIVAWTGETAGDRMLRLSEEEGIPVTLTGPPSSTEPVGHQEMAPVLGLVRTAADADGGMLTEDQTALKLLYRPRSTLYSQTPALVLDYAQGQIAGPLDPVDDDTSIRNDVTVTRAKGGSARVVLASGPLSVQEPPDGVGVYDDSITLSLHSDDQTEGKAHWELHLGTWDEPRYPAVTVNLHRHPSLIPAVLAMREGDVIRLTNMPKWVAPNDVDLMVMGLKEQLLPRTWSITFDCVPAGPWRVGVVDDPILGRVDTDGSQLAAAIDATQTAIPVRVTDGPLWVQANPALNSNASFEESLAGWEAAGASLARIPTPRPVPTWGEWSLQITPDGASQFPNASSTPLPVTAGAGYVASGWLRCVSGRAISLNVNWFDGTSAYLTTSSNSQLVVADTWTWFEATFPAPAGAVTASLVPTIPDFPPVTDTLVVEQVTLRPAGGSPRDFPFEVTAGGEVMRVEAVEDTAVDAQTFTVARSVNGISKSHTAATGLRLAHPTQLAL